MKVRAVCFDYGGTLDGHGLHWLPHFLRLYQAAGVPLTLEQFRPAFDAATRRGYADPAMTTRSLQELVECHVRWQGEALGLVSDTVTDRVVRQFLADSRAALTASRAVLARLHRRVALGVISNFYGNLDRVLAETGIAELLAVVVDSTRVGVSKPDPAIFTLTLRQLGCAADEALYVGDSFDKDIVGAHAAGWRTAWLTPEDDRPCPAPELVDVRLRSLVEVETAIA
jgi:HAD superfamily hydrolase (TIGR01509 family)